MTELLRGAPVAADLTEDVAARAASLAGRGVVPTLVVLRVGERPDDLSYERAAVKRCEKVGVAVRVLALPEDAGTEVLLAAVRDVNENPAVHGCLIMRPLPAHVDEAAVCAALDPAKDVDGVTAGSLYGVFAAHAVGFPPCTAQAVLALLDHYGVSLSGARAAVVGRSLVIGRPVAMMLLSRDATVTLCHTDVGINWDDKSQSLVGDVDFAAADGVVRAITPVPGGVGSVTTAILARHVVEAAERSCS